MPASRRRYIRTTDRSIPMALSAAERVVPGQAAPEPSACPGGFGIGSDVRVRPARAGPGRGRQLPEARGGDRGAMSRQR